METPSASRKLNEIAAALQGLGYKLSSPLTTHATSLYVHVDEPASLATRPAIVDRCTEHWRSLLPLHRWLVDRVQAAAAA